MKKILIILFLLWINIPFFYFVIYGIYNINGFDKTILLKAIAFSIIVTASTFWAMTKGKGKNKPN